jgi:hypothetical protein
LIAAGRNEGQIKRAVRELDPEAYWARPTFYAHKDHITHPLVTQAEAARRNPIIVPKTTAGALEMIRDVGMARIVAHPETISPDHTLKALSILESSKRPSANIFVLLAKQMQTGYNEPEEVIVGEWKEGEHEGQGDL